MSIVEEMIIAMQEFVDRVDNGEVRSKYTYNKFKTILENLQYKLTKIVLADKDMDTKCGGCNWEQCVFYKFEGEPDEDGMCASCMLEYILRDKKLLVIE